MHQQTHSQDLQDRQLRRDASTRIIWRYSPRSPSRSISPAPPPKAPVIATNEASSASDSSSSSDHHRKRSKKKKKSKKKSRKRQRSASVDDDDFVEFKVPFPPKKDDAPIIPEDDDDEEFGPLPPAKYLAPSFSGPRLNAEEEAMQAFLASGKRIPRRGEIGLTSDQISGFEAQGFVMSGSRHKLMNAVRVKKENQVISGEEKKALLAFNVSEKAEIIGGFKELVAQKKAEAYAKNPQ